ncbi:MAG: DUF4270 family protein [Ferruginibacter sp.]
MIISKGNILVFLAAVLAGCCMSSCDKVPVTFGSDGTAGDPNVILIDTFTVAVSTLQVDSFGTSGSNYLIAGAHTDPELGYIESRSYFEITPPTLELSNNCIFDSIVLHADLTSGYMGDTTAPFTLNVHELTQSMRETDLSIGYNTSTVVYNNVPMASKTFSVRPSRQEELSIRLPDDFGKNLFRMFRYKSDTITNIDKFRRFFKGICLASAAGNNAMYYFNKNAEAIIQLHYTVNGITPESKTAAFTIGTDDKQFNGFTYDKTGTPLEAFTPRKQMLISSFLTNNRGYMHYNSGLFPKISLGNLLSIKELHPYVQVMRAELEIRPTKGTWGTGTNYRLPDSLELRLTDDNNYVTGQALPYAYNSDTQYGSLNIDNLYGVSTAYTYDVTSFVNTLLSEGVFSRRALILYPFSSGAASTDQRLLINNSTVKDNFIKLKLYVLGL